MIALLIIALVLAFLAFRFIRGMIKFGVIAIIVLVVLGFFFYLSQHGLD
jgi:flagellar biosynthesis component FlhA